MHGQRNDASAQAGDRGDRLAQRPSGLYWPVLGLSAALVFAGAYMGTSRVTPSKETAFRPIEVDPVDLNIGEVWAQSDFSWPIRLTNHSQDPVHISGFRASCSCLSTEPEELELAPGESATLRLSLDLTASSQEDDGLVVPFLATIVPVIDDRVHRYDHWQLQGQVRHWFKQPLRPLVFADALIQHQQAQPQRVTIHTHEQLQSLRARSDAAFAEVSVSQTGDGKTFELNVQPNSSAPLGSHSFAVDLAATLASGEEMPAFKLKTSFRVDHDIIAVPSTIALGGHPVESIAREELRIYSRSGAVFRCTPQPPQSVAVVRRRPAGQTAAADHRFELRQSIDRAGTERIIIPFLIEGEGHESFEIPVVVVYHGMS